LFRESYQLERVGVVIRRGGGGGFMLWDIDRISISGMGNGGGIWNIATACHSQSEVKSE
jgi:hypothetical protein